MYSHIFECQHEAHHIFLNQSPAVFTFQFAPCIFHYEILQCSTSCLHYALCMSFHMLFHYNSDVMQLAFSVLDGTVRLKLPDSLLQIFLCSSIIMIPSQATHVEKGAFFLVVFINF